MHLRIICLLFFPICYYKKNRVLSGEDSAMRPACTGNTTCCILWLGLSLCLSVSLSVCLSLSLSFSLFLLPLSLSLLLPTDLSLILNKKIIIRPDTKRLFTRLERNFTEGHSCFKKKIRFFQQKTVSETFENYLN